MATPQHKSKHTEKPNWQWLPVEGYLRLQESTRKSVTWNLSPSIVLTNPASNSGNPSVKLYIDTEKSLQYSADTGWNWHKSWNIPNISLRLEIKDDANTDCLLSPRNLFAEIFAVKRSSDEKSDRVTLVDVGIRGESKMEMVECHVYFSAMKFSSTSYNNEGNNFNLLIVLYINEYENEKPKILTAVISPPIFVDSRRSARDNNQKKFSTFVQPFPYDSLQKQFVKRENKSKCESQTPILNDSEGFYNYITAPNIRHKIKHPLFLAIKFSHCMQILINNSILPPMSMRQLLQDLQFKLLNENKNKGKEGECLGLTDDKHYVFGIRELTDSLKRKKVMQSIWTMQNEYIGISCTIEELSPHYVPLLITEQLITIYKDTYDSLMDICHKYVREYPQDSDQSYSDQCQADEESQSPVREELRKTRTSGKKDIPVKIVKREVPARVARREEIFDPRFEAPVFFNEEGNKNHQYERNGGYKNISQQLPQQNGKPVNKFQYADLNRVTLEKRTQHVPLNEEVPQMNYNQQSNENIVYTNMMLTNWLNNVKTMSHSLFQSLNSSNTMTDHMLHKNSMERFMQADQQQKLLEMNKISQGKDQQSVINLKQQLGLYKELLSQVAYQNQLFLRNFNLKQQMYSPEQYQHYMPMYNYGSQKMEQGPKQYHMHQNGQQYMPIGNNMGMPMMGNMGSMGSMGGIGGMGSMGSMGGMGNMGGMGSMGGMGGMGNMSNMGSMGSTGNMGGMMNMGNMQGMGNMPNMETMANMGSQMQQMHYMMPNQYNHPEETKKVGFQAVNKQAGKMYPNGQDPALDFFKPMNIQKKQNNGDGNITTNHLIINEQMKNSFKNEPNVAKKDEKML